MRTAAGSHEQSKVYQNQYLRSISDYDENETFIEESSNSEGSEEEQEEYEDKRVLADDKIVRNNRLLEKHHHINTLKEIVNFRKLDENSEEYKTIYDFFYRTMYDNFIVTQIDQIENPYLYAAYLLKKEQLMRKKPGNWKERWLYHGTKERNVKNISTYNLNWRLCGIGGGEHRWGKGISFTPLAGYSRYYSDREKDKVVLLCYVIVKDICIGHPNMELPDDGCDTSMRDTGQVLVKFEDHEFYPAFKIYYTEVPA